MKKNVAVVTGGAGFVGSHICERLIEEGFRVVCLDNLITGRNENIRGLSGNRNFSFSECDVSRSIRIPGRVDLILHFASPASPTDYLKFPIQTLKAGSLGTYNALGLAKAKRARFLLASTSEVYGDPLVHPQPETYWGNVNPVGVRGCYDEAKRFAEALTMAYHRVHRLDIRIARIFNTYGPRMRLDDGRVIPNFIYQALHHKPITIYGKGRQSRSFCYVSDLVEGLLRLAGVSSTGRPGLHSPVNLGNPGEFTILELVQLLVRLTGCKSRVVYKPLPLDDPRRRQPDTRKAKKLLSWKPEVELETGLAQTIAWFRARE